MTSDTMDKPLASDLPPWLVHPDLVPEGFDRLRFGCGHYKHPKVNPKAQVSPSIAESINFGHKLLDDLERAHQSLIEAANDALTPNPVSWRAVRAAMTSYAATFAEISKLSKRMNQQIQQDAPELLDIANAPPPAPSSYGLVDSKGENVDSEEVDA